MRAMIPDLKKMNPITLLCYNTTLAHSLCLDLIKTPIAFLLFVVSTPCAVLVMCADVREQVETITWEWGGGGGWGI